MPRMEFRKIKYESYVILWNITESILVFSWVSSRNPDSTLSLIQDLHFQRFFDILGKITHMFTRILIFILGCITLFPTVYASDLENDINIRNTDINTTGNSNNQLEEFYAPISEFFYSPSMEGKDGILEAFTTIAFQIKNIFIVLAVLFLIFSVIRLLFSPNDEESVKKWKNNIIWVSVGIFVMQIAFSVWKTMIIQDIGTNIDAKLGWAIWLQVFSPIVGILQLLASFGFLLMIVYAFYTIVWWAWDEEKLKKWKSTILYWLIGFFLIRLPEPIIRSLYGSPDCKEAGIVTIGTCEIWKQDVQWAVNIIGKIILYVNGFLMLVCVLLVLYVGWLVLFSAGDEEKLKKAKSTLLYVAIWFIILIGSHTIFRFFILQG